MTGEQGDNGRADIMFLRPCDEARARCQPRPRCLFGWINGHDHAMRLVSSLHVNKLKLPPRKADRAIRGCAPSGRIWWQVDVIRCGEALRW